MGRFLDVTNFTEYCQGETQVSLFNHASFAHTFVQQSFEHPTYGKRKAPRPSIPSRFSLFCVMILRGR